MKKTGIKTLYRLFALLSDKTNGFAPFVKYKLTLGALLIGISTGSSSCNKPQPAVTEQSDNDSIIETPTCYKPAVPVNKSDTTEISGDEPDKNKSKSQKFIPPKIVSEPEEPVVITTCYMPVIVSEPEEPVKPKDEVFQYVEQMPSFPGGTDALVEFIRNNLRYPENDEEIAGRVLIKFIVRSDGRIDNVTILRSLDPRFDKEAVRLIQTMPEWIPGKQNGKAVDVYYTIPVRFKIPDEENKH